MAATKETFGGYVRRLRLEAGYGLRRFATQAGFQPSNLSNIERGKLPPPKDPERLEQLADALGLAEESPERREFFDLAATAHDAPVPADVQQFARRHTAIPVLLRAVESKKLTDDEIRRLAEHIERHF